MGRRRFFPERMGIPGVRELVEVNFEAASEPLLPHIHPDAMELCYLARGSQSYTVAEKSYPLRGGQMFLTYPNEPHWGTTPYQERCRLYYLIVDTVNGREHFLGFPDGECATLPQKMQEIPRRVFFAGERVGSLFEACFSCAETLTRDPADLLTRAGLRSGLFCLLREIVLQSQREFPACSKEIFTALDYFSSHLEEHILLEDVSRAAGLSLEQLKRRFRREVGVSPGDYFLQQKVQRAGELIEGGASVTEAAFAMGFSSSQHLSRLFKKYFGFPPSALRQN